MIIEHNEISTINYRSLNNDQISHFREHGYVRIGKLLDDDLVEKLRTEYDRLFAEARTTGEYRNLAIDDTDDTKAKLEAKGQMLQIMRVCERSIIFGSWSTTRAFSISPKI